MFAVGYVVEEVTDSDHMCCIGLLNVLPDNTALHVSKLTRLHIGPQSHRQMHDDVPVL